MNPLEKAKQTQDLLPDMECSFVEVQEDVEFTPHLPPTSASPAMGIEDHDAVELIETVTSDNVLKLWPWVNRVSLIIIMALNFLIDGMALRLPLQSRLNYHWRL